MFKRLLLKALETWRTRQSQKIPYTELQAKHVENLKTLANREALLGQLPKQGVVAEVGGDIRDLELAIHRSIGHVVSPKR